MQREHSYFEQKAFKERHRLAVLSNSTNLNARLRSLVAAAFLICPSFKTTGLT